MLSENDPGASPCLFTMGDQWVIKAAPQSHREQLRHEIRWLTQVAPAELRPNLPEIFDFSLDGEVVYMRMKRYHMPTLRTILFNGQMEETELHGLLREILARLETGLYANLPSRATYDGYVELTHVQKLATRLEDSCRVAPAMRHILEADTLIVNDREVAGIPQLISQLNQDRRLANLLTPQRLYVIHGDLHLNNILFDPCSGHYILLDPRGHSPGKTIECDLAYEIAKVAHDLHGMYSLLHRGHFSLGLQLNPVPSLKLTVERGVAASTLTGLWGSIDALVHPQTQVKLGAHWKMRVMLIESLLFCSMLPFYGNDPQLMLALLATGLVLFDQVRQQLPDISEPLTHVPLQCVGVPAAVTPSIIGSGGASSLH